MLSEAEAQLANDRSKATQIASEARTLPQGLASRTQSPSSKRDQRRSFIDEMTAREQELVQQNGACYLQWMCSSMVAAHREIAYAVGGDYRGVASCHCTDFGDGE